MRLTFLKRPLFVSILSLLFLSLHAQQETGIDHFVGQVFPASDLISFKLVHDPALYSEKWDTLSQVRFWQEVMETGPETSIVNIASGRKMLGRIGTAKFDSWGYRRQKAYLDSTRRANGLSIYTNLYVTAGKKEFYRLWETVPHIDKGISIFMEKGVDPWYAQAILLIESPGALQRSSAGAYGPFQLMPAVAREHGLKVNSKVDERTDIELAANGAASLLSRVCIPETRRLLRAYRIPFQEDDLWFRLMVLHVYHAGYGNVYSAFKRLRPRRGGQTLITRMWKVSSSNFRNASQNYSQVALAALVSLDKRVITQCEPVCHDPADIQGMSTASLQTASVGFPDLFSYLAEKVLPAYFAPLGSYME
jgi:hypothetical protein